MLRRGVGALALKPSRRQPIRRDVLCVSKPMTVLKEEFCFGFFSICRRKDKSNLWQTVQYVSSCGVTV